MIANNRKTVRKEFAALLERDLVGSGKPAVAVYDYRVGDFKGASPVVVVSSAGTMRERLTFLGTAPKFRLQVDVFVLYATEDEAWTEENAEDLVDDLEEDISAIVDANQKSAYWGSIAQSDWSSRVDVETSNVEIAGVEYIRESLILEFE